MLLPRPNETPFLRPDEPSWTSRGRWPARWIHLPGAPATPHRQLYRLRVEGPWSGEVRVSADESYRLLGDGALAGPEQGHHEDWAYDRYSLDVPPEGLILTVEVDARGPLRAYGRHSVRSGLIVCADDGRIDTGVAPWEVALDPATTFLDLQVAWGVGAGEARDSAAPAPDWQPAESGLWGATAGAPTEAGESPMLRPARLPRRLRRPWPKLEVAADAAVASGQTSHVPIVERRGPFELPIKVAEDESRRIVLDLGDYVCGLPRLRASGTGSVRVHWQESLLDAIGAIEKGDRDAVDGKYFTSIWHYTDGIGDLFRNPGDGATFEPTKWQAGRYVELLLAGPVTLEEFEIVETRAPLEREDRFTSSDESHDRVAGLAYRTLQSCAHDTYMDCPFYERLQYIGDTRLQSLVTFVTSHDGAGLPEQALRAFDLSRQLSGITLSRAPSYVRQVIPEYSLWYVNMVHDLAMWRGERAFVSGLMPGVRGVLDHYKNLRREDGLLDPAPGWNMVDWVPSWPNGCPPGGHRDPVAPVIYQAVLAFQAAAELEEWLGEPELATRHALFAAGLMRAADDAFFHEGRLWDDLGHSLRSEHTQSLAILSGSLHATEAARALPADTDLARATVYYSHYIFDALAHVGRTDVVLERLDLWRGYLALGLKTAVEMPEPTRSDCHAWGAHPLYHLHASLSGVRPGSFDFDTVRVDPCLGGLELVEGAIPHPGGGEIVYRFTPQGGEVTLPEGITGMYGNVPLNCGPNKVGPPRGTFEGWKASGPSS